VGQVKPEDRDVWVPQGDKFVKRTVRVSPALTKVFDEILVNALDQSSLNPSVTKISIDVDESGRITIANNGISIPVVIHEQTQVWTPELIFGHLLTSSNYDDSEVRDQSG
jgi:DNA topoisomerase-2